MWVLLATVLFTGLVGNVVSQNCLSAVNSKEYCWDVSTDRTWKEAKFYCEMYEMDLATILTSEENDKLKSAYNPDSFHGDFWVAGRDVQNSAQFTWSLPRGEERILDIRYNKIAESEQLEYQTCLFYSSVANDASVLKMATCTSKLPTLCERIIPTGGEHENPNDNKTYFY